MVATHQPDERRAFSEKSYDEVLDATKHQDDKIGRFLTAIAFLFTGSVALGVRGGLLGVRVELDGQPRALAGLFLGLFLVLSVLSVLLLVVALGPNLSLPRGQRKRGSEGSRLFFLSIAGQTPHQWDSLWRPGKVRPHAVIKTYVDESHNLAFKTDFKYNRTNEARAVFTLGLMFLALAVALFLDASARAGTGGTSLEELPLLLWDLQSRLWLAAIISAFAFVLAYDYVRLEQEPGNYVVPGKRLARVWPGWILAVAAPLFSVAVLLPSSSVARMFSVVVVALCAVASVAALILRRTGQSDVKWPWIAYVSVLLVGTAACAVLISDSQTGRLAMAVLPVVGLEAPRLLIGARTFHDRMRSLHDELPGGGVRAEWKAWKTLRERAGKNG